MIRRLDHTSDIGFELQADSLPGLFEESHRTLIMIILESPPQDGLREREVDLFAPDLETLPVRWLNELTHLNLSKATVNEEISRAYKDATSVVDATDGVGLGRKVARLRSLSVVKARVEEEATA